MQQPRIFIKNFLKSRIYACVYQLEFWWILWCHWVFWRCTIERIKEVTDQREMNSPDFVSKSNKILSSTQNHLQLWTLSVFHLYLTMTFLIINVYYLAESPFYFCIWLQWVHSSRGSRWPMCSTSVARTALSTATTTLVSDEVAVCS